MFDCMFESPFKLGWRSLSAAGPEQRPAEAQQCNVLAFPDTMGRAKGAQIMTTQTVTFGAGCFWGVEYVFRRVPGVTSVEVGYGGGITPDPTYREVCSHTTGHAEVCRSASTTSGCRSTSCSRSSGRCTTRRRSNRQGPDVGDQYRSAIFTTSDEQQRAAEASRERAQARFDRPIATEIRPGAGVLRGRGLPPGLLREERPRALLSRGSGEAPGGARSRRRLNRARTVAPGGRPRTRNYGIRL